MYYIILSSDSYGLYIYHSSELDTLSILISVVVIINQYTTVTTTTTVD